MINISSIACIITIESPSYLHGVSPNGKTLAYCAQRGGNFDIDTILAAGGEETRLTTAEGLDNGSEYSPDDAYIYFTLLICPIQ
jgi:Tol biopolymer transport system component